MADALTVTISVEAMKRLQELAELNEKQYRLLMGMLADQRGYGGGNEVARVFAVGRSTVSIGQSEFSGKREITSTTSRIRRPGGGRKAVEVNQQGIVAALQNEVEGNSSGSPENPLLWTTLSQRSLAARLVEQGFKVGSMTVGRLLDKLGYSTQQNRNMMQAGVPHPDRDSQFRFINSTVEAFLAAGDPVISIDCNKKELFGNFRNNGGEYRRKRDSRPCSDLDLDVKELGAVAPYGVCVLNDNAAFVNLTRCADSGAFAVESIRAWWQAVGSLNVPDAKRLLITCDGGGNNGLSVRLWQEQLAVLAAETGLELHVCHFPPGTSKWNRIEHRLFGYISRNREGKPLIDIQTVVNCISGTTTGSGLKVRCRIDERQCHKGIPGSDERMESIDMTPMDAFGKWNYVIRGFKKVDS